MDEDDDLLDDEMNEDDEGSEDANPMAALVASAQARAAEYDGGALTGDVGSDDDDEHGTDGVQLSEAVFHRRI